ncbi:6-phosphogluconolactonase [Algoriphagus namhaensis]
MKLYRCKDYQEMSSLAAENVLSDLKQNPNLLFCAASGGSPTGLYQQLVEVYLQDPSIFEKWRILKLDEWVGLPENSTFTSEYDIQTKLLKPTQHPSERYFGFDSDTIDPESECQRMEQELAQIGPIDTCILGIGVNGHLALNEPADFLQSDCHVAKLSPTTLQHGMIQEVGIPLTSGMTLGMGNISASRKIILLLTGKGKKAIIEQFLEKKISTYLPASLLWLHPHAEVFLDESALL